MEKPASFEVSEQYIQQLVNYFATLPYGDVFGLMEQLRVFIQDHEVKKKMEGVKKDADNTGS